MKISKRISRIEASPTLAITSKAKKMKSEGLDVISFGAGEPDFDTPSLVKESIKKALDEGFTKYTPATGTLRLKELVCEKFKKDNGLDYLPENVVISCGAKHSIFNIILTLIDSDDEVLIPDPYWVSYPEMVKLAGGKPISVKCHEENGFRLTAEEISCKITSRTKLLIINSPCNPTGAVYKKEDLEKIAELCVKKNIIVISDEIYEKIIYSPATHVSIASLNEDIFKQTIVVNGCSKSYSMTGLRIGYIAGPVEVVKGISKLQSHSTSNPVSIIMRGLENSFWVDDEINKMRQAFEKRRDYIVNRLGDIPGITCNIPEGAFYVFPNIKELGLGSFEFAEKILKEKNVAVVPGKAFGVDENIRLSYASDEETIKRGLDRIEEFAKELSK
ncbi:MAG: pyridoxal phosphate-dependent aminotransferase [Candidatus Aureabacteria bacterium]|nr:pyridoxal phosphate-dependent aminotransferase [Candidatus Auribacterota bacterium]